MAKKTKRATQKQRRKKFRWNPVRLLILVAVELSLLLGLLVYISIKYPDNEISKNIVEIASEYTSEVVETPLVVLDPGHGGYDVGSEYMGIYEKDTVLALALDIGESLEEMDIPVVYTRVSDDVSWPEEEALDLSARAKIANESGASVFVSIHTNATETKDGQGFEVWADGQDIQAVQLSNYILEAVDTLQYTVNRGIKDTATSPIQVLQETNMTAVLVEAGFLESDNDRSYLLDDDKRKILADQIAKGIRDMLVEMEVYSDES